jgi:hypothetical protein
VQYRRQKREYETNENNETYGKIRRLPSVSYSLFWPGEEPSAIKCGATASSFSYQYFSYHSGSVEKTHQSYSADEIFHIWQVNVFVVPASAGIGVTRRRLAGLVNEPFPAEAGTTNEDSGVHKQVYHRAYPGLPGWSSCERLPRCLRTR